jgi:DNA-binding transcriptional ArsR family regulator
MAELIIPSDKVRDLAEAPRRVPIDIEGSVTHEIILTMWTTLSPKRTNSGLDLGSEWVDQVNESTPDDLADEIVALGGPWFYIWLVISNFLLSAPHPHDPDRVLAWLDSVDDSRLRRWILGSTTPLDDDSRIEKASQDLDAAIELIGEGKDEQAEMVEYARWMFATEGLASRYADAIRRYRAEVFNQFEEDYAGAIGRAAAARRAAPTRGDAKSVIEEVTSGLSFDVPVGVRRVTLVPSVVTRPLSLIDGHRGSLVVYYGIPDEFINSDPEAPPSWMVRSFKALSDDKRLRILRRLSDGEATLDELTNMLGLSKSTVHHHISLLRGAGLIRVHVPSDDEGHSKHKMYSLRDQSLTDVAGFLDSYLRTTDEERVHA